MYFDVQFQCFQRIFFCWKVTIWKHVFIVEINNEWNGKFFSYWQIRLGTYRQLLYILYEPELRPNLKNLSRGLKLRRGSNMLVPLRIVFNVSRFKPSLNWNRLLADLRRGLYSLNSDSGNFWIDGSEFNPFNRIKHVTSARFNPISTNLY